MRHSQVWHSSLSSENRQDLERVQRNALRIILGSKFTDYENALIVTGLESLDRRREYLCLNFAKGCLKHEQMKEMFPLNPCDYDIETRCRERFSVTKANSERHSETYRETSANSETALSMNLSPKWRDNC